MGSLGIRWENHWFVAANYTALLLLYLWIWVEGKKRHSLERVIRSERMKGADGNEQVLTAELPTSRSIETVNFPAKLFRHHADVLLLRIERFCWIIPQSSNRFVG